MGSHRPEPFPVRTAARFTVVAAEPRVSRAEGRQGNVLREMNRGSRRLAAFAGAIVASALLCALWAGVASAARIAADPGAIEICKAPENGAVGQPFSFT